MRGLLENTPGLPTHSAKTGLPTRRHEAAERELKAASELSRVRQAEPTATMVLAEHALRCSLAASLAYLSPTQLGAARKEWRHTGPFYAADPGQEYASRLAGAGLAYAEQVLEPSLAASA